jgi:hypothetical protein
MTKQARAVTAIAVAVALFIGAFAFMGYHVGLEFPDQMVTGWPAALAVAGLATSAVGAVAVLIAVTIAVTEWVYRGRS